MNLSYTDVACKTEGLLPLPAMTAIPAAFPPPLVKAESVLIGLASAPSLPPSSSSKPLPGSKKKRENAVTLAETSAQREKKNRRHNLTLVFAFVEETCR